MNANNVIVLIKIPIDKMISHPATSTTPTLKNIIIGDVNGIKEDRYTSVESGAFRPNIAIKKAIMIKNIIGINNWLTSSTRLTSEPNIAAIVAYNKYPSKKKIIAYK